MIKSIVEQMWLFTVVFVLTFGLMIVSSLIQSLSTQYSLTTCLGY